MQRPQPPGAENKLMLLCVLDRMGALSNLDLQRFCVQNDIMGYMDLQLLLSELVAADAVAVLEDEGALYALTEAGRAILGQFAHRVPFSRLQALEEAAEVWRNIFIKEREAHAAIRREEDGSFTLEMTLREEGMLLCQVSLRLDTQEQAKHLQENWPARAADVYAAIVREMSQ